MAQPCCWIEILLQDILCNIFLIFVQESQRQRTNRCDRAMFVPIHLLQICKRWHSIVEGYLLLWTFIVVSFFCQDTKKQTKWLERTVATCLIRSKNCPLDIEMICIHKAKVQYNKSYHIVQGNYKEYYQDTEGKIMKIIHAHQYCWEHTYFSFDNKTD